MEHGKDPLVSSRAEWAREYQIGVERRHSSSSTIIRRRHRRRITHQTKYARRRIVRMVIVCSVLLAVMAASIYVALSRVDGGDGRRSDRPTTPAGTRNG